MRYTHTPLSQAPLTRPGPCCAVAQVWNMNAVGGIVGLFNVQGATWRTHIRTYHQHDPAPRTLTAHVRPCDVPLLPRAERYVAYSDKLQVPSLGWSRGGMVGPWWRILQALNW